jgi:hypothetical protein
MKPIGEIHITIHADTKPMQEALRQMSEAFGLAADHLAAGSEDGQRLSGAEALREPGFEPAATTRGTTISIAYPPIEDVERFQKVVADAVSKLTRRAALIRGRR